MTAISIFLIHLGANKIKSAKDELKEYEQLLPACIEHNKNEDIRLEKNQQLINEILIKKDDYEKYMNDVMRRLEEEYGKQKWDLQIFFEEASGADPNRKEFNRLKAEIAAKKIDVVVTMRAATIARDWGQFMEFMLICSKRIVEVVCIDKVENAQAIFRRIQEFQKKFFEGSDVTCE